MDENLCDERIPSLKESPCRSCPRREERPKCLEGCLAISAAQELLLAATEGTLPSARIKGGPALFYTPVSSSMKTASTSSPSQVSSIKETEEENEEDDESLDGEEDTDEEDEAATEEEPSDAVGWEDVKDSPDWVEVPAEDLVARLQRLLQKS